MKGNEWGWGAPAAIACAVAGVVFLAAFVLTERRVACPIIDQVLLALAALVQIFFEPASPVWLVLVGLGLFGFGWGLRQASSVVAQFAAPVPQMREPEAQNPLSGCGNLRLWRGSWKTNNVLLV